MENLYEVIASNPTFYRQLRSGDSLITIYNCPLKDKFNDLWTDRNYIIYVLEGKKVWHTGDGSYEISKGSCVFVRKGAFIVEQFFDKTFCFILFFISDDFICSTLKMKSIMPKLKPDIKINTILTINKNEKLEAFYLSMSAYFNSNQDPDSTLLELKFRELILTIADNPHNQEVLAYFCKLYHHPSTLTIQQVMEDNFHFNLSLEKYAALCNKSLSAFKRDFQKIYHMTPGKWLLEKKLNHAFNLLRNTEKSVSDVAFESGFENLSHFSRSFKERYDVPPVNVKKAIQN